MKNFKLIIVICLILSMLAMLVACGGDDTDTADGSDTSGEATVTEESESTNESTNESDVPSFDGNGDDIIYDIF